jgi:hypothetical protein
MERLTYADNFGMLPSTPASGETGTPAAPRRSAGARRPKAKPRSKRRVAAGRRSSKKATAKKPKRKAAKARRRR